MIVKVSLSGLGALAIVSVCLYSFSLLMLYIMSTLYHWQPVGKRRRAVFRRFDHCSIALLIAGTYAPFMLIGMYSANKVWAIVLASVVLHVKSVPERVPFTVTAVWLAVAGSR